MTKVAIDELVPSILQFLADDDERMARFFALTGLTIDTLCAAVGGPEFTKALLDYLLEDEPLLLLFADTAGLAPESIGRARAVLEAPPVKPKPTLRLVWPLPPARIARRFAAG